MEKRKNLNLKIPYIVILTMMAVLAVSSFFVVKRNMYNPARERGLQEVEPVSHEDESDGSDVYSFEFMKLTPSMRNLLFFTNHQEVRVYMNDVMIYANERADSIFGHTTAAVWNQIELPEISGTVKVRITPVYPGQKQTNYTFYLGNGVAMGYAIIRQSFPSMLMCLLILIIGICTLCFWGFSRFHHRWPSDILFLGLLTLFLGVWALGETQGVIYLLQNRVAASYTAYTCLMAVGILFVMFTHRFMHLHDKIPYGVLMTYGMVEVIVCELLQFFNIRDMKQTVVLTHTMIVASIAYMLLGICVNLRRHCYLRRTVVNAVGFVVLSVTMIFDMYMYYNYRVNVDHVGKFGILIYILMIGVETLREASKNVSEEQHLQMYREMAMKDMLTGCYNRNAYDEELENAKDVKWSQVVTFDLNDLKRCNDTYGHQSGDKYLCDAASIIRNVYGKYGRVYRIGGDEFCVITRGLSMQRLRDLQARLAQAEREYNQRRPDVAIEIACGYALYDERWDTTIEDIRLRADVRMYEDKKELKAKSDGIRRVL